MSRVVTSAEIDRLHGQVTSLNHTVYSLQQQNNALAERVSKLEKADEEFAELVSPRLPNDESGPSDQDGDFLQP